MIYREMIIAIIVSCSLLAQAQTTKQEKDDQFSASAYIPYLLKADPDSVTVLISPGMAVVRSNGNGYSFYYGDKDVNLIKNAALKSGKHVVITDQALRQSGGQDDKAIDRVLDEGLKQQGYVQRTTSIVAAEENSPPTKRSELLYDCSLGFGFNTLEGAEQNLRHNAIFIPESNRLLVTNRLGTVESTGKNSNINIRVQPVDEKFPIAVTFQDGKDGYISYGPVDWDGTDRSQETDRKVLSGVDAEAKLQSLILNQANKDQKGKQYDAKWASQELQMTLQRDPRAFRMIIPLYKKYIGVIDGSEKKLESCQKLNNGTITQAASIERAFLENQRVQIKEVFKDYLDLSQQPCVDPSAASQR